MSARNWPIRVRVARPEDREAVLGFATTTWGGWDYIPEVWDEWVVPSDGVVLVATVDAPLHGDVPRDADGAPLPVGQPIAMTRVVMLSATEAWLEGIRVDPRVRGMGVATDLQVAELRWISAHGADVVRYMTSSVNVGSQRLGAHHGLVEVGRWRTYGPPHDRGGEPIREATEIEAALGLLDRAEVGDWDRVRSDPMLAAGHHLYEYRPWAYQELTEERFRLHVQRGEAIAVGGSRAWAAVIVNRRLVPNGQLHLAFATGDGATFLDLLKRIGRPPVRLPDPDPPILSGLEETFPALRYPPMDESEVVVERLIDAAHPLPEAEDKDLLVFGETPRRIAEPKVLTAH